MAPRVHLKPLDTGNLLGSSSAAPTIGAVATQIPCRHGTQRSHHRCRIYDCKRKP